MDLDIFFEDAKADIERKLRENVEKYAEHGKLAYFINHGKRLRSLLSILAFKACGGNGKGYESALDLAVAIELQHSASLVHDDIIDRDNKRRAKPSYYKVFGIDDAVLTGHRAIVLGFKRVLGHDPRILDTFFKVWDMSLGGEIDDIESRRLPLAFLAREEKRYFEVIEKKTASLFAGAAKIGSQEASANEELQNIFWEYGKFIGIAYQLTDDKIDLTDGSAEIIAIAWAARRLDEISLASLAKSLGEGSSPAEALSRLNVNVESTFNEEIARWLRSAESLAESRAIPKSKFSPLLAEAPSYIINGCLKS